MPALSHIDPRSGPTGEEAEARDVRLLDVATRLFMERGFDGTSIDAVAEAAGLSKPTVYARYHDKRDLFAAVLRGRRRRWLAPVSAAAEAEATEASPKSIKTTLHELSRHMVAYTLAPEAGALQRILSAQAVQFPDVSPSMILACPARLSANVGEAQDMPSRRAVARRFVASRQTSQSLLCRCLDGLQKYMQNLDVFHVV